MSSVSAASLTHNYSKPETSSNAVPFKQWQSEQLLTLPQFHAKEHCKCEYLDAKQLTQVDKSQIKTIHY